MQSINTEAMRFTLIVPLSLIILFCKSLIAGPFSHCGQGGANDPLAGKPGLSKVYSNAIKQYLRSIHEKDKTTIDTLYFNKRHNGQPDDFPDIDLPQTINGTRIILLTTGEAASGKFRFGKSSPCINLIGWVDKESAEIIFVTFYPGFQHQYDCYISYNFNSKTKEFDLQTVRIEVLIYDRNGKADHFAVYKDGKYTGDKPIRQD